MLDSGIGHRMMKLGLRDCEAPSAFAVTDLLPRYVVLRQLIDERTRQDKVKELVDLGEQRAGRTMMPGLPPKDSKDLDRSEQWPVSIRQMWSGGGYCLRRLCRGLD